MQELAGGPWTWAGRHPDWNDDPHWGAEVRSYALRTDGVILFDPIEPPEELTREGNVQVVLTAEWHGRDAERCSTTRIPRFKPLFRSSSGVDRSFQTDRRQSLRP